MGLVPTKSALDNTFVSEKKIISHMKNQTTKLLTYFQGDDTQLLDNIQLDNDIIGIIVKEFTHGARDKSEIGVNWCWNLTKGISINCPISLAIAYCDILPLLTFSLVSKKHRTLIVKNFQPELKMMVAIVTKMNNVKDMFNIDYLKDSRFISARVERPESFGCDDQTIRFVFFYYFEFFLAYYDQ